MVSDWLKKQKKPTRTNHIRAVSTTKCKKMAPWFSAKNDLILHAKKEDILKNIPTPEHSKKYVFVAKCIENVKNRKIL